MHPVLNQNSYFVKEHTGIFKAANNFDIFNPQTQELILTCREEKLGFFTRLLRFTDYKRITHFNIEVRTAAGEKVLTVRRGLAFFVSTVEILDENDELVGRLKQKFFSIGGKFNIVDANDNYLFTLQGKWTSWDFKFVKDNLEFAHVSKKWAGIGKEFFTSADNYILNITDHVPQDNNIRLLILGAVMCIDMVLKE
ncbi:phospholipid scramblase-related protein [Pontibacter cellulosilyticus]|uniref:RNAase n=1 Tax=Pontibacter cellulosilyticus TaxID=1720253 RepID=A0A923N9J8_9BACT|nr:phospholipid scramblase-related protein [Pontibacter cellulosilyticus]MBC5994713.1 RNAase [Pontibacter cellulosilyticus]